MISLIDFEGGGVPPDDWMEDWGPNNLFAQIFKDILEGKHDFSWMDETDE